MESKRVVGAGNIAGDLIAGFLVYGIIFGILYQIVYSKIVAHIESLVVVALIAIVLQGIIALILWKCSTSSAFKKKTMDINEVPKVMKILVIFTIVICVLNGIINYFNVDKQMDSYVDYELKFKETIMENLYSDEKMQEYYSEKEAVIKEAKSQLKVYLIIIEIGLTAAYLVVLPIVKNGIVKKINEG